MTHLTVENLESLVGKKINWEAPAYYMNYGFWGKGLYGGITRITEVDLSKERPILKEEKIDEKSDSLIYAFIEFDVILAYSDGDRFVSFEIIEE